MPPHQQKADQRGHMTSKQDYEQLAKIIRRAREDVATVEYDAMRQLAEGYVLKLACDIATWCGETNPRFDRTRFLLACGISNEQG